MAHRVKGSANRESDPVPTTRPSASGAVRLTKSSILREVTVWLGGEQAVEGVEQGSWTGVPDGRDPGTRAIERARDPGPAGEERNLAGPARALWRSFAAVAGLRPAELAVRVTDARVRETVAPAPPQATENRRSSHPEETRAASWTRRVVAAQALVGRARDAPVWSRVCPLSAGLERWPAGWPEAAARAASGRAAPRPAPEGGWGWPREPIVLDPFALSDIVRIAAAGWLVRARPGARVGSRVLVVEDPGSPFAASGGDRDALGAPAGAAELVRGGLLVAMASDPSTGRPAPGFAVRDSWRRGPRAGWRALRLTAPPAERPARAAVVTQAHWLGGRLLLCGVIEEDGSPRAPFGPVAGPGPPWWLRRIAGTVGQELPDATGLPVAAPPVLVDGRPGV